LLVNSTKDLDKRYNSKHQPIDLANVLRRSVETASAKPPVARNALQFQHLTQAHRETLKREFS
jgi:hypothetical protein